MSGTTACADYAGELDASTITGWNASHDAGNRTALQRGIGRANGSHDNFLFHAPIFRYSQKGK
jgi:hypothetical protein